MTTLQSLLAGVIMNPDEDTPRLMYADELTENGNENDRLHAEYIKKAIEFHIYKKALEPRVDPKAKGISISSANYRDNRPNTYEWYLKCIKMREELDKLYLEVSLISHFQSLVRYATWIVERGFIKEITCNPTEFLHLCDSTIWHELLANECPLTAHPIRKVTITRGMVNNEVTRKAYKKLHKKLHEWREGLAPLYGIEFKVNYV
jgi:uncharacterized protein (TIGR02996 family)